MRASRFLSLVVIAATVAATATAEAQNRRPRPGQAPAPAAPAAPAVAAEPIPPAAQAPGDVAPNAPTLLSRESHIRPGVGFQAFIDGQILFPSDNSTADRGASLNDGALYFSKDFGSGLAAMIDLPFSSTGAADNDLTFGQDKAQAYFQYNRGAMTVRGGQFDTIFGLEQNDSKDRFFADSGLAKQSLIPVTHTGVMVGAGLTDNFSIRGLIADPQNTSTMAGENAEFGLQGRFEMAPMYVAVGALYNKDRSVPTDRNNMLIDVMAGFRANAFRLDGYYVNRETAGQDDAANVIGLLGTFALRSDLDLGARLEYGIDPVTSATDTVTGLPAQADNAIVLAVGPSWQWLPEVKLRADVTFANYDYPAGVTVSEDSFYSIGASMVAGF